MKYRLRCTWHGHPRLMRLHLICTRLAHSQGWHLAMSIKAGSTDENRRHVRAHERVKRWQVRIDNALYQELNARQTDDEWAASYKDGVSTRAKRKGVPA